MSRYSRITESDFNDFMFKAGFVKSSAPRSANSELIYTTTWHGGKYLLIVFSSIVPGEGSRDVGTDAIRLVLKSNSLPLWKARVFRVEGWRKNLGDRIDDAKRVGMFYADKWQCPMCRSPLVKRKGKNGIFVGCVSYTTSGCRYTANV